MGDVVRTPYCDMPAEKVLEGAAKESFRNVIVCGYAMTGEFTVSASHADAAAVLWDLEMAKRVLYASTKREPGES